ncbi:MAG TPA: radical SAM protein, partial [Candidatus Omnitrophica bacterium]|nr:radical SAM protein [Candidatus Omnitrophota bacterium]
SIPNRRKRKNFFIAKKKKLAIIGGEPTLHPDFVYILNNLDKDWRITVTSNFTGPFFEGDAEGLRKIKKRRHLRFNGSYHFLENVSIEKFIENVIKTKKAGIKIHSIFIVGHPGHIEEVNRYKERLRKVHPNVKVQRFYGYYQGRLYPLPPEDYDIVYEQQDGIRNYKDYPEGFSQESRQSMYCLMNKVLFAPNGDVYKCHYRLYTGHKEKMGNLFNQDVLVCDKDYFLCHDYGFCNPCDAEGHPFKRLDGTAFNIAESIKK